LNFCLWSSGQSPKRKSSSLGKQEVSQGIKVLCLSSFRVVAASLSDPGIQWGRAWSPPRRLPPHAYSHRQPSFLLLLLLGAHILCSHLPEPSVISHRSSNCAFPDPDSPAGMEILPFPPDPLSSPPNQQSHHKKEGWLAANSTPAPIKHG